MANSSLDTTTVERGEPRKWGHEWSCSSRSGETTRTRACRSAPWPSATASTGVRCARRSPARCRRRERRPEGRPAPGARPLPGADRRVARGRSRRRRASSATPRGGSGSAWSPSTGPRSPSATVRQLRARRAAGRSACPARPIVPQVHHARRRGRGRLGRGRRVICAAARSRSGSFYLRACHSGGGLRGGLPAHDPAGVPGGPRRGLRILRRRLRADPLRQPGLGGEAGAARPAADRVRSLRRHAKPLPLRVRLHAGRASRAPTRRAASRARWAASAAAIWCRCPRSARWAELDRLIARRRCARSSPAIAGRPETVGEAIEPRAGPASAAARRAPRGGRALEPARRRQGAGERAPEPLLGAGGPGGHARAGPHRGPRDRRVASAAARWPATSAATERLAIVASLDHYLDLLRTKAGGAGGIGGPFSGARARRLAGDPR